VSSLWLQAAAFEKLGDSRVHSGVVRRGLPQVVGALDGSHILVSKPAGTTDEYCNRKKSISILLQGICDAAGRFIDIYTGWTGRIHDAKLWRESPLGQVGVFIMKKQ
jgi:hypothetical protein